MEFHSETRALRKVTPRKAVQGEYSFGTSALEGVKIVSLDPRHSDEEQKSISFIFENQFAELMGRRRYDDARVLVETILDSFPGIWRPVQEREDCVVRTFWDESEYFAYQSAHPNPQKPVVWGLPSLSRLFYQLGGTYSRQLEYGLAHTALLNGFEYEPDHPGLWMAKGNILSWENRFEEALEAFQIASTIRSWTPPSILARCIHGQGWVLGELKRFTEARDAFERALAADPDYEDAQLSLRGVTQYLWQLRKLESSTSGSAYRM
jgi:tetratricopeptide (TPR) repeat protein